MRSQPHRPWALAGLFALVPFTVLFLMFGWTPLSLLSSGWSDTEESGAHRRMPRIESPDFAMESAREFRDHLRTKGTAEQKKAAGHVLTIISMIDTRDGDVHIGTDLDDDPTLLKQDGKLETSPGMTLAWAYADWKETRTDATVNVYNAADQNLVSGVALGEPSPTDGQ
ncbi:hypothetical protein [Streptomyces sp. NPDC048639]|uniref:hypothetical protein n=1 Tax=Streptomyces sp. NPDC048639 TaxID=3365581 RepID=UPI003721DC28